MKQRLLALLPHVVAIILFAGISMAFFSPVFEGYTLRQGDISNFLGMSKEIRDYRILADEDPLWTNSMFGGMPAYQIAVIHSGNLLRQADRIMTLYLPRPVDTLFLAMLGFYILLLCMRVNPWVAIPGAIAFGLGSFNILYLGAGHTAKVKALAYMAPVLGGFLLTMRGKVLLGSALTAFFLGLHLSANHLQMTYYLLFLLLFAGIGESIRLLVGGELKNWATRVGVLLIAGFIGVLPSMSNLLTTSEYSTYTTRGESELTKTPDGEQRADQEGLAPAYMLEYNMSRGEFLSMLIPDAKGGASGYIGNDRDLLGGLDRDIQETVSQQNRYWGDQSFTGGAFYFGAAVVFLFLLSLMFFKEHALKWSLFALVVFVVVMSWKQPSGFGQTVMDHFPLFNKFRDTKMMLVLAMIIMPFLGFSFLDRIIKDKDLSLKAVLIGSGAVVAILLVLSASPGAFMDFLSTGEQEQFSEILSQEGVDSRQESFVLAIMEGLTEVRMEIFRADAMRSLLLVVLAAAVLMLLLRSVIDKRIALPVLGLIMLIDLWSVDRRYLDTESLRKNPHWQEAWQHRHPFEASMADQEVFELETRDSGTLSKVNAMAGQIAAGYEAENNKEKEAIQEESRFAALGFNSNYRVLNLNNPFNDASASYFHKSIGGYHGAKLKRYQELIEWYLKPEMESFVELAQQGGLIQAYASVPVLNMLNTRYIIYNPEQSPLVNPLSNGNAWFVSDLRYATDADEEMEMLAELDLGSEAVVDARFKEQIGSFSPADSAASVSLSSYRPNELVYEVSSGSGGLIVFSEIHYPEGWKAYVNDQETDIVRANYVLRALKVGPGEHTVRFRFEPTSFATGTTLSIIGSILVILLLIFALWRSLRKPVSELPSS